MGKATHAEKVSCFNNAIADRLMTAQEDGKIKTIRGFLLIARYKTLPCKLFWRLRLSRRASSILKAA
jgi:hypothetical protein